MAKLPDMRRKEYIELLETAKNRFKVMADADDENRREAMEDIKFTNVPGHQWDFNMKQERGHRPCYEFNKVRQACKRVINDMRANRPQAKVRPVEGGDKDVAEINEGLIRNIWNTSDAETILDYAAEFQVPGGMGAWRVSTKYADEETFNQEICIKPIQNPFMLYCDPAARDLMHRDARDWVYTDRIAKYEYDKLYPNAGYSDFEGAGHEFDDEDWFEDDSIRVAEYWYRKSVEKEIAEVRLPTGEVRQVELDSQDARAALEAGGTIQRQRKMMVDEIWSVTLNGARLLSEPQRFPGRNFPFIMVYGEYAVIDGRPHWWGLTRFAKDAQRSYNVARTAISETIAQAPKSFFWATDKQADGHTNQWSQAHKKNYPFLLYTPDPMAPGTPQRVGGADVPVALIQETQLASDEIKAVTGIYDASMGARSNESSGRAIYARQQQGEISTFNFADNMSKGVQRTYEIILGMLPEVYDTKREIRILGSDGAEAYKTLNDVVENEQTGELERINDIAVGKYDVTVDIGPNFQTLRQEAAEVYGELINRYPDLMGVAGDLIFKSMDLPYADDIAERFKFLLPPQIQQSLQQDAEMPPEVQQAMQMVEQRAAQLQEQGKLVQAAMEELMEEKEKAGEDKHQAELARKDVEIAIERLRREEAEFEQKMAEATAEATADGGDVNALREAVASIDLTLANFMTTVDQALAEVASNGDRQLVGSKMRNENGMMVADLEFNDGSRRTINLQKAEDGMVRMTPDSPES